MLRPVTNASPESVMLMLGAQAERFSRRPGRSLVGFVSRFALASAPISLAFYPLAGA